MAICITKESKYKFHQLSNTFFTTLMQPIQLIRIKDSLTLNFESNETFVVFKTLSTFSRVLNLT